MSIVFACSACGSPSISLPQTLDDEALVHCGRCHAVVGRWGPFKALARCPEAAGRGGGLGAGPPLRREDAARRPPQPAAGIAALP